MPLHCEISLEYDTNWLKETCERSNFRAVHIKIVYTARQLDRYTFAFAVALQILPTDLTPDHSAAVEQERRAHNYHKVDLEGYTCLWDICSNTNMQ